MKRRNFVKAILCLAAVPLVAKASQKKEKGRFPEGYRIYDYTSNNAWYLDDDSLDDGYKNEKTDKRRIYSGSG